MVHLHGLQAQFCYARLCFVLSEFFFPTISVLISHNIYILFRWFTASSITAVCNQNMVTLKANEHHNIMVSREKVIEKALELCDLLQYEFTFMPVSDLQRAYQ